MKKVFITGCAGYIAGVVCEKLLDLGYSVSGIDDLSNSYKENVKKEVKFFKGNYGDKELLNKIFNEEKPEVVLHFAAETTIAYSMTDPYKYFENNLLNGLSLLESMRSSNITNIIVSSTAAVYGIPEFLPINEKHSLNPMNAYGESKLMLEKALKWYGTAYGFQYNVFRYFNASGATERSGENRKDESHILPLIYNAILNKKEFKIYGDDYFTKDGTCIRDYIHVEDIADAHIKALDNLNLHPAGIYNLGSGKGVSVKELVKACEEVLNTYIKIRYENKRTGDPAELVAAFDKAHNELGWDPVNSDLENIINSGFIWYKKINASNDINV